MPRPVRRVFTMTVAVSIAICMHQAASAGAVYKCVDGGRVSYGDRPCPGKGGELAVPAAPVPDPQAEERLARRRVFLAELDKAKAAQAAREERDSALAERAGRAALGQRRRCDKLRLQKRWTDEDLARAGKVGKDGKDAARIKARRQAETVALECPA